VEDQAGKEGLEMEDAQDFFDNRIRVELKDGFARGPSVKFDIKT